MIEEEIMLKRSLRELITGSGDLREGLVCSMVMHPFSM
jgi:hypothetical protein